MPDQTPGRFIVIEGLDGSGKSTQLDLLHDRITAAGYACHLTSEPTDLPPGRLIRRVLRGEEQLHPHSLAALFAADRLEHLLYAGTGIEAHLSTGTVVLSGRYYFSSLAYQSTQQLGMHEIARLNAYAMHLRPAALTLFLDLPPEVGMERIARRGGQRELFETERKLRTVRANFMEAFARYGEQENIVVVDARPSIAQVADTIWNHVKAILP